MKLKWNLNQTETSLLENITNMGESNNREKTVQNNVICGGFFKKFMFCSTKKARFDKSTKKERNFSAINKYYDFLKDIIFFRNFNV